MPLPSCSHRDPVQQIRFTGCFYKLSRINLVLKCPKSNFNPMHVFLHFKSFCLVLLQLILASKLSELEQFEKQAENCLLADKIEFFGKWLHPRAKLKKTDPTLNSILLEGAHHPTHKHLFIAWQWHQSDFCVIFALFFFLN